MDINPSSSQTLRTRSLSPASTISLCGLDLSSIPPIAVLNAHLKEDEERELKEILRQHHAPLTSDFSRAKVFIGKVGTKRRAEFELRSRKIAVEDANAGQRDLYGIDKQSASKKKRKYSDISKAPGDADHVDSTTEEEAANTTETEEEALNDENVEKGTSSLRSEANAHATPIFQNPSSRDIIWVIKLDWLDACVTAGHPVPLGDSLVFQGEVTERSKPMNTKSIKSIFLGATKPTPASQSLLAVRPEARADILDRARKDATGNVPRASYQRHGQQFGKHTSRRFEGKSFAPSDQRDARSFAAQTAHLLQSTTSEYEGSDSDFPVPPEWVKRHVKYACQRYTPANGPNEDFIEQLRKIRTARTLIDDEIGVRAYSTIIASIAAYPHKLSHPRELAQLPGCDEKTAVLFVEWKNTGKIQAVDDCENDEAMKVLRLFYDIWGVGAKTARHFYYNQHWTELDDIIEYGWSDLDRVQQIGVKYYDEFLIPIPRLEVEQIASVVQEHAVKLRDTRITVTIVGGYRRGKAESGDVDLIVSHPDLEATAGLIQEMVESLEATEWITHTLTMSLTNTHRGQNALPFRSARGKGVGYDTLDKALVVWQNPVWLTREQDIAENPKAKNPNIHRRVDIIIAPWRTVGCAVMGWSGGTTFQRDLRRYAKAMKDWKFDSSGIRSRANGEAIMLEGEEGIQGSPEDAEKRVFEGLGLEFIPPEYRVTY